MIDIIKVAADYIRTDLSTNEAKVGSSHAHAAVSALLGYNSKKALIDSGEIDIENEDLVYSVDLDVDKLAEQIGKMGETPLKGIPVERIADSIRSGLTRPCECCAQKGPDVRAISDPDGHDDEPAGWVCRVCSINESEEYASCIYCGDLVIYRAAKINKAGECPEHKGESHMDEEEESGWNDLAENLTKDM